MANKISNAQTLTDAIALHSPNWTIAMNIAELESKYSDLMRQRDEVRDQLLTARLEQAGIVIGKTIIVTNKGKRYIIASAGLGYNLQLSLHGSLIRKDGTPSLVKSQIYSFDGWKIEIEL